MSAEPQWKKDLIARLRASAAQHAVRATPCPDPEDHDPEQPKMVQKAADSSDEDLRYGPGIVSRLKERYLSLAQREAPPPPARLRKAASLENVLDEGAPRLVERPRVVRSRERSNGELIRSRSVEVISERPEPQGLKGKRESLHEEVLVDMVEQRNRINRPKALQSVVAAKEKPPADFVKNKKRIYEKGAQRITGKQTGEVAVKVAKYNIIDQQRVKPAIKAKPTIEKRKKEPKVLKKVETRNEEEKKEHKVPALPSPIPDVSRVDAKSEENDSITGQRGNSLTETPDLIVTSSPVPAESFRKFATESFIKEEIRHSEIGQTPPPRPVFSPTKQPSSPTFKVTNKNILERQMPPLLPLKVEINGEANNRQPEKQRSPKEEKKSPELQAVPAAKPPLTSLEIEKNLKNSAKSGQQKEEKKNSVVVNGGGTKCVSNSVDVVKEIKGKVGSVKTKGSQDAPDSTSQKFSFLDRPGVPSHVPNDGVTRTSPVQKPKVGDSGIIVISPSIFRESFTDEDEELFKSLEGPPSPCDVAFINDNILIDGKSSLRQKTKSANLTISFDHGAPQVFEYPSETSLLIDDTPDSPPHAQIRPSVPSITGSSLANYTPKSTEDFQPGITRSSPTVKPEMPEELNTAELIEVDKPITFSSGTNSDILF